MRFTSQNLNDRRSRGSAWREGRCWLWPADGGDPLQFEWCHFRYPSFAISLTTYGRGLRAWKIHVALFFGSWWLSIGAGDSWGRTTGVSLWHDWLRLFWREQEPDLNGPAWSVRLLDVLLGRTKYREGSAHIYRATIWMPERGYSGTFTLRDDSWKRPRWFRKTIRRAHIEMDPGEQIPVPGKGENAWDCDEDAVFGITAPANNLREAVLALYDSVMRTRERHGGLNWTPAAK